MSSRSSVQKIRIKAKLIDNTLSTKAFPVHLQRLAYCKSFLFRECIRYALALEACSQTRTRHPCCRLCSNEQSLRSVAFARINTPNASVRFEGSMESRLDDVTTTLPTQICGTDLDDLFAYPTAKTVRIRDARLGILRIGSFLMILIYVVVYSVRTCIIHVSNNM